MNKIYKALAAFAGKPLRLSFAAVFAAVLALAFVFVGPASAENRPPESKTEAGKVKAGTDPAEKDSGQKIVLELFTSQGCSSCPKADALLPEFIKRKDVIAISMSINYWDYLGWRDTFGKALFTDRQRSYGKRIGDGIIYTPQMIVDGRAHVNGSNRSAIEALIAQRKKERARTPGVALDVITRDDMLIVTVGDAPAGVKVEAATLWMALFSRKKTVKVQRGENRGRYLTYHNVVRELAPIGRWTGARMTLKLPKKPISQRGADGCVILLQNGDGGPIVAAAQMSSW